MLSLLAYQDYYRSMFPAFEKAVHSEKELLKQTIMDDAIQFIQKHFTYIPANFNCSIDTAQGWSYNVSHLNKEYFYKCFGESAVFIYVGEKGVLMCDYIRANDVAYFDYLLNIYHYVSLFNKGEEITSAHPELTDCIWGFNSSYFLNNEAENQHLVYDQDFDMIKDFLLSKINTKKENGVDEPIALIPALDNSNSHKFVDPTIIAPWHYSHPNDDSKLLSNFSSSFLKLPFHTDNFLNECGINRLDDIDLVPHAPRLHIYSLLISYFDSTVKGMVRTYAILEINQTIDLVCQDGSLNNIYRGDYPLTTLADNVKKAETPEGDLIRPLPDISSLKRSDGSLICTYSKHTNQMEIVLNLLAYSLIVNTEGIAFAII